MGNEIIFGMKKKKCDECADIDRCGMMKIGCWNYETVKPEATKNIMTK